MKEVLAAVKKKNKGREPKLSPIEEDCKKVYHKLNKDVVGISKISLNKHYADNFAHKWLSLFNFDPLEVFPQEAFKMNYTWEAQEQKLLQVYSDLLKEKKDK